MANEFLAKEVDVGLTISATTLAVTLVAPFAGVVADILGRKMIIVGAALALTIPIFLISQVDTLNQIVILRFIVGLLLPPVFAVAIAYVGDEFPREDIAAVTALYTTGSIVGGFSGRFIAGWGGDLFGWRYAFMILAAVNLASALIILWCLPRERNFVRASGLFNSFQFMVGHFRDPRLVATFGVGFGVLFCLVTLFTYINFYLAAPPFNFSASGLGTIFVVYLFGIFIMPLVSRLIRRFGRRALVVGSVVVWAAGILVTLIPHVPMIGIGLVFGACMGFICQATSTGFIAYAATRARSSAVGLYVTFYYLGGTAGGVIGGLAWHLGGWPACVALVWIVLVGMGAVVLRFWRETPVASH